MNMKRIAVITGASSGLGRAYAARISEDLKPDEVWLIARRKERLLKLAETLPVKGVPVAMDITDRGDMQALKEKLAAENPDIVCLVNAAGMGKTGDVREQTPEEITAMVSLNCTALAEMTSLALPYMKRGAWLIQVASIAAFQPMPGLAVYGATKAFVERFSEALKEELKEDGILVTCVCPYWVKDTEFIGIASEKHEQYRLKPLSLKTAQVIEDTVKAVRRNRMICTPGIVSTFARTASKIVPDQLIMKLLNLYRKK